MSAVWRIKYATTFNTYPSALYMFYLVSAVGEQLIDSQLVNN
jgi:hypothetical protein